MLGIYCVCYRKDRTIIFCLLASGSKSFWLLHLPVRREFFAAKKHLLLASFTLTRTSQLTARQKKSKSFVVTPWLLFQGKEAVTQCVLGQGFEAYKCNPTSLHSKPTWDHPPVNTSDCVRHNFLQWQTDVSIKIK